MLVGAACVLLGITAFFVFRFFRTRTLGGIRGGGWCTATGAGGSWNGAICALSPPFPQVLSLKLHVYQDRFLFVE